MPLGKKGAVKCVPPLESLVTLAVTVEVPPAAIVVGFAVRLNTSQGLSVTVPDVVSLLFALGPALLPHQFNVASTAEGVVLFSPTELPTIRLKWAVACA